MTRSILFICIVLFSHISLGQDKELSSKAQNKKTMELMITQLKEGVLLTRLFTKVNSINSLRQQDKNDLADKMELKQRKYNQEIISGFRKKFSFCPVYFFYSSYTDSILSKKVDVIVFLNDSMQPDPSIKLNGKKFLIAEFGNITQDTAKYFNDYYYVQGKNGLEERKEYNGGNDMKLSALRILSDSLVQLKKPFPYYVSTHTTLGASRSISEVISMMDQKLNQYYLSVRK